MSRIVRISSHFVGLVVVAVVTSVLLPVAPADAATPSYPAILPNFAHPGAPHSADFSFAGGEQDRPLLVILQRFSDVPDEPGRDAAFYAGLGFGTSPSIRDFWATTSFGHLLFTAVPRTNGTPNNGVFEFNSGKFADNEPPGFDATRDHPSATFKALKAIVDLVDFASLDRNRNGNIDTDELAIVRVKDATAPGDSRGVNVGVAHVEQLDGMWFDNRSASVVTTLTPLSTFNHELGHQMFGLPDTYANTPPEYIDLMGAELQPSTFWRMHLGWAAPQVVTSDGYREVPLASSSPTAAFLLYDPDRGPDEYMLVERRGAPDVYDPFVNPVESVIAFRMDDRHALDKGPGRGPFSGKDVLYADPCCRNTAAGSRWNDGSPVRVGVRAARQVDPTPVPGDERWFAYLDVRGPGVLVDPPFDTPGTPPTANVTPSEAKAITFPVQNTGEATDTFAFSLAGLPAGWTATTDTRTLGDHVGATASIQLTPAANAPTGPLSLSAVGRSTLAPGVTSSVPFTVNVVLDPTQITYTGATSAPTGQPAGFSAQVSNPGDDGNPPIAGDTVTFSLSGPGGSQQVSEVTDANGVAVANPVLTVPSGNYTLTYSVPRFGKHEQRSRTRPYEVLPSADLSITKSASLDPVIIDEEFAYTLTVGNAGPDPAALVKVTDALPPNVTFVSATPTQGTCSQVSGEVTCALGTVARWATPTVALAVIPRATGTITNRASVSSPTFDPVSANNQATVTTQVVSLVGIAFGASVKVATPLGIGLAVGPTPRVVLPRGGGGPVTRATASVSVPGLLSASGLAVSTQGGRSGPDVSVTSSADVALASLASGAVVVEGVHSDCRANLTGATATGRTAKVRVGGATVAVSTSPNSTLKVPGVGTLFFNEQVVSGPRKVTVNAVRLRVAAILLGTGDIVIGQSVCGVEP